MTPKKIALRDIWKSFHGNAFLLYQTKRFIVKYIDGLAQVRGKSIADLLELPYVWAKPWLYFVLCLL